MAAIEKRCPERSFDMTVLITGATGQFGSVVVESLLAHGLAGQLAVSVRNPARADHLKAQGVDVRQGDFDNPASLASAFAGVDRLLLISATDDNDTRIRQHKVAVRAAEQRRIRRPRAASAGGRSAKVTAPRRGRFDRRRIEFQFPAGRSLAHSNGADRQRNS